MHVKIKISWTKLMIIEIVLYFFFQAPSSYYVGILIFLNVQNESCSHQIIFIENEKISQKILFVTVCVHTHCQKMVRKMKILKFLFAILNHHISDYYHAKFGQNRRKKFSDFFRPFLDHCAAKKIFSPILTKFCVVIVKNMVIQNIKKIF